MPRSEVITRFATNADPSKHSAAYKIFHYKFICSIAAMHLQRQEHLEVFGYVTSGDAKVDRALAHAEMHVQLTIAAMAQFYDEGIPFKLVDPKDSVKIYQTIHQHLMDWKQHIEFSSTFEAPIDELRKLDAVAAEVYGHARFHMQSAPYHGVLLRNIDGIVGRRGGIRRRGQAPRQQEPYDPRGPQQNAPQSPMAGAYTPMADAMGKTIAERKKSWR